MLRTLYLKNVALVDEAEIAFSEGLNVLSGETGAGKSVILDSIDFVLGAKADKGMIRSGQSECSVRAEFSCDPELLRPVLEELDLEESDTLLIVRRLNADGRSSLRVNGCPMTAAMLRKLTSRLVDVHGQSEHFFLLKEANQLRLLDQIAGTREAREKVGELLKERRALQEKLSSLGGDEGERERRADILRFQIEELENAALKEGEEEELLALRTKYQNAEKILGGADLPEKYYTFKENVSLFGLKAMVSRTGYTGEDGFEIALPAENAVRMWKSLTEAGKEYGLCPAGLGARDTLRLEAAMPLYGHELRSDRLASEAGLDFAIKYGKPDFVGKKALQESEPAYHRTGAFLSDKGIAREGAPLFDENGEEVGEVTSGTMSPTLGRAIAMLRLKNSASGAIFTQIRGKTVGLELTALPFYKRK